MNKILKFLYKLTLVLLFLPAFAFPLGERSFRIYFIFLLSFFGLYIALNFKTFINKLLFLFKKTSFRYLVYFLVYLFVSAFIILLFKPADGKHSLLYITQLVFLYIIPSFLLSAYFITNEVSLKKYIKFYYVALFSIFIFGLIEFIGGKILHIEFINMIQQFLANERNLAVLNLDRYAGRLASVFAEPGWLGGFIFLNFPIIYKCSTSKYKIFSNKYLNMIIKRLMIPLTWLNLIFTISPIWLILCSLQVIVIYWKKIIKLIFNVKTWIILLILLAAGFIFILLLLAATDKKIEIAQFIRIFNTIANLLNFHTFLMVEPSLGARIVSYYVQIKIFLSNSIIGIGLNNAQYYAAGAISKYHIPMTVENFFEYQKALKSETMHINTSAFYTLLSEAGMIGTFLYYLFIIKSITYVKKAACKLQNSLEHDFSCGLMTSLIFYVFMTFYDTLLTVPYNWFFFGFAVSVYLCYINIFGKESEK